MSAPEQVVVYTDGGARGNPGPAALGASVQTLDGEEIDAVGEYIGEATNNVAEYSAVVVGLRRAAELGARRVVLRSDSELLVKQLTGVYKIKKPHLQRLALDVRALVRSFEDVRFEHVRREANTRADELVNIALDEAALD